MGSHQAWRGLCVRAQAIVAVAVGLSRTSVNDSRANGSRRLADIGGAEQIRRHRRDVDGQVEPIAQRPGQAIAIAGDLLRRATALAAAVAAVAEKPAWAWVHGSNQHEARGE